ncbi:hypothetical protein BJ912DRAFT_1149080 [Pholiota molesta]|nr:hypothetical protein BJ912DRAFT_1149080 [Pholiota molesta]
MARRAREPDAATAAQDDGDRRGWSAKVGEQGGRCSATGGAFGLAPSSSAPPSAVQRPRLFNLALSPDERRQAGRLPNGGERVFKRRRCANSEKYATKAEFEHLRTELMHLTASLHAASSSSTMQCLLPAAAMHPSGDSAMYNPGTSVSLLYASLMAPLPQSSLYPLQHVDMPEAWYMKAEVGMHSQATTNSGSSSKDLQFTTMAEIVYRLYAHTTSQASPAASNTVLAGLAVITQSASQGIVVNVLFSSSLSTVGSALWIHCRVPMAVGGRIVDAAALVANAVAVGRWWTPHEAPNAGSDGVVVITVVVARGSSSMARPGDGQELDLEAIFQMWGPGDIRHRRLVELVNIACMSIWRWLGRCHFPAAERRIRATDAMQAFMWLASFARSLAAIGAHRRSNRQEHGDGGWTRAGARRLNL